jgi:hypothetical protein
LATRQTIEYERKNSRSGKSKNSFIFTSTLFVFGAVLFCSMGFKFIRKSLDTDRNSGLLICGAFVSLICTATCLIYRLLNLIDYRLNLWRQHENALISLNGGTEDVIVEAIIIPELELRNVKWHVLGADHVERANDTALEDAPEAINRLNMDGTDHVLPLGIVNGGMRISLVETLVANPFDRCRAG